MRIAYFTDTDRLGGAERVLVDLIAASVDAGHEVVVMCPQSWLLDHLTGLVPQIRPRLTGDAGFRHEANVLRRGAAVARQIPELIRALRDVSADVLHVNNGGYPGSDLCRLSIMAARAARVPKRLLTVHAVPRPRAEGPPGQRLIDAAVWRCADAVIGGTRAVSQSLHTLRGMPPELFVYVPYGVHRPVGAQGAPALREQLGVAPGELLVGMVSATSDAQKGHSVFVEAVNMTPGARGIIVGAPPPPDVQAAIASSMPEGRVTAMGRIDDLGVAYHAMDALVVPSVADESLPLVVLEAMACGTPVLASRLSGIPEAVQDGTTGALFTPGSSEELAGLLRDRNSSFASWGAAGSDRWASLYSVDAMTRSILSLYR